jgi:structural maintenance of chromosome 2
MNISLVIAQNLQDLIYKRGQAGITHVSVTLIFDNRDPQKCPFGHDSQPQISVTRQVVMGGTSKYLINGHRTHQQAVQNLFQPVQLNVNNPNFLIMQGHITKVLSMKPLETLSMIEEAVGIRVYEEKKKRLLRRWLKKTQRLLK